MNFVYAAMWLLAGIILIFRMGKENKVFYFAGGFFLVLGVWWLTSAMHPEWNVFEGVWGVLLRVVTAAALLVLCYVFFKEARSSSQADKEKKRQEKLNSGSGEHSSGEHKDGES